MNKTKIMESKEKIQALKEQQLGYLGENTDEFGETVKKLTVKEIDDASDERIIEINRSCSTGAFIAEPEFESEKELAEYLRGILRFLVQTYEFTEDLDKKMKELDEITEETNKIIKEAFGLDEDANAIDVLVKAIESGLEKAKALGDEDKIKNIEKSKATFNETFTLDRLKDLYKNLDPENLKSDASSTRSIDIYNKYIKVQQKLGSRYDLCNVADLEVRFLPEKYHGLNNLFVFACIKYISKLLDNRVYSSDDGLFVSQLTTNLFMLSMDKLPLEYKEILITNIQEFLDIIL